MINARSDITGILYEALEHPGCRASSEDARVLLTVDGRAVRMYECRGPIDAGLIASKVDANLRPLDVLADEVAAKMATHPGTLAAFDKGPAVGTVALFSAVRCMMDGWWNVGTYVRGLQLIALVAARLPQGTAIAASAAQIMGPGIMKATL